MTTWRLLFSFYIFILFGQTAYHRIEDTRSQVQYTKHLFIRTLIKLIYISLNTHTYFVQYSVAKLGNALELNKSTPSRIDVTVSVQALANNNQLVIHTVQQKLNFWLL